MMMGSSPPNAKALEGAAALLAALANPAETAQRLAQLQAATVAKSESDAREKALDAREKELVAREAKAAEILAREAEVDAKLARIDEIRRSYKLTGTH